MTVNRTTLLNLPLPVTGTEPGVWGDYVNNGFTQYVDASVAGALSITATTTLANTTGTNSATGITSTTAQYRTLVVPASGVAANVVITAPSSNRTYHVVNLNGTYTVQIRAGANSGVTLGTNQSATVTYDSVAGDYVLVGTIGPTVPVARGGTGLTSGTSGGVPYFSATNTIASSAALAANALVIGGGAGVAPATTTTGSGVVTAIGNSTNTASGLAVLNASGNLNVAQGGTGAGTFTANNVLLGNGTSAFQVVAPGTNGNVLTSNGTTWVSSTPAASGVSAVSVASANGFAGTSSGGTTPALTLSTSITGVLKGNGTAISAAVSGTDIKTVNGTSLLGAGDVGVGVTSVAATNGTGISISGSPITSSGTLTITNTGVTSITAGTGISVSASTGSVTITNTASSSTTFGAVGTYLIAYTYVEKNGVNWSTSWDGGAQISGSTLYRFDILGSRQNYGGMAYTANSTNLFFYASYTASGSFTALSLSGTWQYMTSGPVAGSLYDQNGYYMAALWLRVA